ncbi:hypothetical protein VTN31DRAFT_6016 [Thermomyces dupontii]|uniref:uncharacterized protein n=1 Tax=Talaromyces thermophilus TaxID=28565 RepID=UPI0037431A58
MYPDDMFSKAFVNSMDYGREVVAKVPNANAGFPHFTTASEVATMDFRHVYKHGVRKLGHTQLGLNLSSWRKLKEFPCPLSGTR